MTKILPDGFPAALPWNPNFIFGISYLGTRTSFLKFAGRAGDCANGKSSAVELGKFNV